MALTKRVRKLAPKDGTWVRTEVNLGSILNRAWDGDRSLPGVIGRMWVPAMVRLVPHEGESTRQNPEGIYYHAEAILEADPDRQVHENLSCYAAQFTRDSHMHGWEDQNQWIYAPFGYDVAEAAPGEDASWYSCDQCGQGLYRDEDDERHDKAAVLYDGALVCRDCDVRGLVATAEVRARLDRCRIIASILGSRALDNFDRQVDFLASKEAWGSPAQTRIWLDGEHSFTWRTFHFRDGERIPGMFGGLIYHGPRPVLDEGGSIAGFETWDYEASKYRPATGEERVHARWGIHT